jgi:hypothetical protein
MNTDLQIIVSLFLICRKCLIKYHEKYITIREGRNKEAKHCI